MSTPTVPFSSAGQFDVDTAVAGGEAVLCLVGELDCATSPLLRHAVDKLSDRTLERLVFDMSGLAFIDSSGLNELVRALLRQRETGGEVMLRRPNPQTMQVLEIVGLTQVFTIA